LSFSPLLSEPPSTTRLPPAACRGGAAGGGRWCTRRCGRWWPLVRTVIYPPAGRYAAPGRGPVPHGLRRERRDAGPRAVPGGGIWASGRNVAYTDLSDEPAIMR